MKIKYVFVFLIVVIVIIFFYNIFFQKKMKQDKKADMDTVLILENARKFSEKIENKMSPEDILEQTKKFNNNN